MEFRARPGAYAVWVPAAPAAEVAADDLPDRAVPAPHVNLRRVLDDRGDRAGDLAVDGRTEKRDDWSAVGPDGQRERRPAGVAVADVARRVRAHLVERVAVERALAQVDLDVAVGVDLEPGN